MTVPALLRDAAARLRCDHRFRAKLHATDPAPCGLCGMPWAARDMVAQVLREPLATLLESAARMRGTPEADAAALNLARAILDPTKEIS